MAATFMLKKQRGRPPLITLDQIADTAETIGLQDLSLQAVAARLKVSNAALYRYVDGIYELETLIGERVVSRIHVPDNPDDDAKTFLLTLAETMFDACVEHPGLSTYLLTDFPRGDASKALIKHVHQAMIRRGYSEEVADITASTVATMAISWAEADRTNKASKGRLTSKLFKVVGIGTIDGRKRFSLMMKACISGLVDYAQPGQNLKDVISRLEND